ncbi:thioredoxin domain-containing protein [Danxiaibacter flavus]|uniref:Thioredoxin domain-containing protein n=1 Tax=Danxiaibacter flavus TaxID=3049108 RepID=A0ABV3ZMX4_9BACT|nr:thioredoxin domain-containing protein [Chitinophagaceae bacterium DXS]
MKKEPNRLIHETSPYLLQHAYNPVQWYPWSEEALERAVKEDKPILVSIGYSACHWCHVMERESFENEDTAAIMNEHFINIKIDREERPDLDHIYMDAVQAMTGGGGWPLNVFLTPDKKPFYGGTYFPPVNAYNRMSWRQVLASVNDAFKHKRDEIETQAFNLTEHLEASNSFGMSAPGSTQVFTKENAKLMAENMLKAADKTWGGFGRAPKFPQTFSLQYLLQYYYYSNDQDALQHVNLSLDKMIQGGIYDHIGGGFARYSTDEKWLAPHFEKMLYDNALLLSVLSEAYQLTGNSTYRSVIDQTIEYTEREMLSPEGGFYSALDADSEGVEGKYYTWSWQEIHNVLGDEAELFCNVYDIQEGGNWEHTNIIWLPATIKEVAERNELSHDALEDLLKICRQELFNVREKRVRPGLDDKILLGWNALMISAYCKAYAALGNDKYLQKAERSIQFLEKNLKDGNKWYHSWKENMPKYPAFLDDFAYLIQAYIHLHEVTGENGYLSQARELLLYAIDEFDEEETDFFYYTGQSQKDVLLRKKEVYDGAVPSGNAVMALNLYYLAVIYNETKWRTRAENMVQALGSAIVRYPTSFGVWAFLLQQIARGWNEIAIAGKAANDYLKQVNHIYLPGKVSMVTDKENNEYALLENKTSENDETLLYWCSNYSCSAPEASLELFIQKLKKPEKHE